MSHLYNLESVYSTNATSIVTGSSNQGENIQGKGFVNTIWEQGKTQVKAKAKSKILSLAKQLLNELFGSQTAAATGNAATLGTKAATTSGEQVKSLADIENMVNNLSAEIGKETKEIEKLLNYIQKDLTQKASEQEAKIREQIELIRVQQAIIANPEESIDNKLKALDAITTISETIQNLIKESTEIQQLMVQASEKIATSKGAIEELTTLSGEQIEQYTQEVTETAAKSAEGTAEATETGVRAGVETGKAAACTTAAATAGAASIVTVGATAPVAGKLTAEAGDQTGAASIDGATSVTAGASFVATIGSLTNNTSILDAFKSFIGSETQGLMGFLGQSETLLNPLLTSVGTMVTEGAIGADMKNLSRAVSADKTTLSSQKSIGSQKSYAAQNTEEYAQPELETPKFQFTFGI